MAETIWDGTGDGGRGQRVTTTGCERELRGGSGEL